MKHTLLLAAGFAAGATSAWAGGIDRSGQSIAPIFETGTYVEFSFGHVSPEVSGVQQVTAGPGSPAGAETGNVGEAYSQFGAAVKADINEKLSYALIWDQPFGANINYAGATGYLYGGLTGSTASIDTNSLTGVLRYKIDDRFSVHGGLRILQSSGEVALFNGYTMETSLETDVGWLLGAAYEIPDIALRAALTYSSAITHDFTATESGFGDSDMATVLPKSVNLDFQTGIAANTLLMASVRWAEWTKFDITPVGFETLTGDALVSYDDDTISYSLGVGRKFNDKLSGSFIVGYEKSTGGFSGNLGPTDGYTSAQLGLKYQLDAQTAISGGLRYVWVGDAKTQAPAPFPDGTTLGDFTGNSAVGVGIKLSRNF